MVTAKMGEVKKACGTLKKLPDSASGIKKELLEKGMLNLQFIRGLGTRQEKGSRKQVPG